MLIVFQTPFADARDFISKNTFRLKKPELSISEPPQKNYQNPKTSIPFIHRFGPIEKNKFKKIDWTSTEIYCSAKQAFKFHGKELEDLARENAMIVHSRRLFPIELREIGKDNDKRPIIYQNKATCSLEIGFIHASHEKLVKIPLSATDLNCVIKKCVNLNVIINLPNKKSEQCELYNIDRFIDNIYLNATTEKAQINKSRNWWVTAGTPLLIVQYSSSEVNGTPPNAKLVKHIKGYNIRIFFGNLKLNKKDFLKTWYIVTNKSTKQRNVVMLLEGLLHINSSQQCLNRILNIYDKIKLNKKTAAYDNFQKYLELTFASLFKRERFGFPCKKFAEVLIECEDSVSKTMRDGILTKLRDLGIRGNSLNNLEKYINLLGGNDSMVKKPNIVDILILTAVKDELDVLLRLENDWHIKQDKRGYNYYVRQITIKPGQNLTLGLAKSVDMGGVNATSVATRLSNELNPNCLAMVGICAGWRRKVNLGDVIVAERVFSYDNGKLISFAKNEIQEKQVFNDIQTYNLNPVWKQKAENMTSEWKKSIKTNRPIEYEFQELWVLKSIDDFVNGLGKNPVSHDLRKEACPDWTIVLKRLEDKGLIKLDQNLELTSKGKSALNRDKLIYPDGHTIPNNSSVHVAPIATGNMVVEDRNTFPKISRDVRSVLGFDMEACAVGTVSELEQISKCIIVKGVSDYADEDKNDHFRNYSIEASYRFLISFLRENYSLNK